jgi:hypothetical protein
MIDGDAQLVCPEMWLGNTADATAASGDRSVTLAHRHRRRPWPDQRRELAEPELHPLYSLGVRERTDKLVP